MLNRTWRCGNMLDVGVTGMVTVPNLPIDGGHERELVGYREVLTVFQHLHSCPACVMFRKSFFIKIKATLPGDDKKMVVFGVGAHHKVEDPPGSCGQNTIFCFRSIVLSFFFCF